MSDSYVIDTNIVINLHRSLPRDIFPSLWVEIENLIEGKRAVLPKEVLIELEKVDDDCAPWAKGLDGFVVETTDAVVQIVTEITKRHPGWVTEQKNEADPWVVGYAVSTSKIIVTEERRRGADVLDRNLGIPNVADEYGVPTLTLNDVARNESWVF